MVFLSFCISLLGSNGHLLLCLISFLLIPFFRILSSLSRLHLFCWQRTYPYGNFFPCIAVPGRSLLACFQRAAAAFLDYLSPDRWIFPLLPSNPTTELHLLPFGTDFFNRSDRLQHLSLSAGFSSCIGSLAWTDEGVPCGVHTGWLPGVKNSADTDEGGPSRIMFGALAFFLPDWWSGEPSRQLDPVGWDWLRSSRTWCVHHLHRPEELLENIRSLRTPTFL